MNHIREIIKRDGRVAAYGLDKIAAAIYRAAYAEGGHDRQRARFLAEHVELMLNRDFPPGAQPTVEDIQDRVEKALIEHGHARTAKAFILFRNERAQARVEPERARRGPDAIPYRKVWQRLAWNLRHGISSIEGLNRRIDGGGFCDLVTEADAAYEQDVALAAADILERRDEVRLVIIAGPSSSGKTTTTRKIARRLAEEGLELVALELDNYFYDLEVHPTDERGDHDFETPSAIDIPLVNDHLTRLLDGEMVPTPRFDFKAGKRLNETHPLRLEPGQIILIDSLHGLSPALTESVPGPAKLRLYIETLCQILDSQAEFVRWTDVRLLRRTIRDMQHRNHTPQQTLEHWHYVRSAEKRYIFPYLQEADVFVNGSLAYDLPVLKKYLFPFFQDFYRMYAEADPDLDAVRRARRIFRLLSEVRLAEDVSCIPPASLLREFIGGSSLFED